jgi:hypothetical protein
VGRRRVDLKEAAEILGSTTEALRKRAKRGTLDSETGEDGKVYVWVDDRVDDEADRVDGDDDGHRDDHRHRDELISYMARRSSIYGLSSKKPTRQTARTAVSSLA